MDEVFGNSSTETVVSVHDLDNAASKTSESNEPPTKETVADNLPSEITEEKLVNNNKDTETDSSNEENGHSTRESVIKCVTTLQKEVSGDVFKIPMLPFFPLRHTQSAAIVQTKSVPSPRIRAHSTTTTGTFLKHHPYQNIPLTSFSMPHINSPPYVNLPKHRSARSSNIKGSSSNDLDTTSSAPSTPRGSRNPVSPRVNTPYIQLWTGIRQEPKSSSDQDEPHTMSASGYVRMSSPYLRSPNSSILSDLACQLSSYNRASTTTKNIFCPFCPRPFTRGQNLKHHIQAIHRHALQEIACSKESVTVQHCPLCQGRFFNLDLLPCHLLEFHRESVVDILDKYDKIKINNTEIKCTFCAKKVPSTKLGEETLLYHLLQLHCTEYETLIRSLFRPVDCFENDVLKTISTEDLAHALSFRPGSTSTPGLSIKFKTLSCETGSSLRVNETNLEETWSSHCAARSENVDCTNQLQTQTVNKGILRSQTDLSRKPSVKRELRFSVPPVTSEEYFIPESPESSNGSQNSNKDLSEQDENHYPIIRSQNIPVRVDSLSSADFIEMNNLPSRKRRRLGIGLKSKKCFKKKEANHLVENVFDGLKNIGCGKPLNTAVVATTATRTFRKPKPVAPPTVPVFPNTTEGPARSMSAPPPPSQIQMGATGDIAGEVNAVEASSEVSPFGTMKLYSPLRMFRCNSCRIKFCDNESLSTHIRSRHRGFLGLLRPQFGCGICSAKFYENKYLVKHCLQHHTSLLEIRSPKKHKITIYRFTQD